LEVKKENDNEITKLINELEDLYKQERILSTTKNIIAKKFISYLINEGASILKNKMNEFFNRAYGKYSISFINQNNSIDFFYQENKLKIPTSVYMASGFEKDIIALANRIALSYLCDFGIMLLDEVDSQAGDYYSNKLLELLINEKNINQIFLVTHNESSKELLMNFPNTKVYCMENGKTVL